MLPTYKEIIELIKKGSTLEAQEKISLLREEIISLREEKSNLLEKLKQIEVRQKIKSKLEWDGTVYWLIENKTDKKDGPYCQKCQDADEKLIRLQGGKNDVWFCHQCKSKYFGADYVSRRKKIQ